MKCALFAYSAELPPSVPGSEEFEHNKELSQMGGDESTSQVRLDGDLHQNEADEMVDAASDAAVFMDEQPGTDAGTCDHAYARNALIDTMDCTF